MGEINKIEHNMGIQIYPQNCGKHKQNYTILNFNVKSQLIMIILCLKDS